MADDIRPRLFEPALSGLRLPQDAPLRRDMPLPQERRSDKYIATFDDRTLVYDAVQGPDRISLFCPRLLNLWPHVRDGLRLDGAPVQVRRYRSLRFERLDLPKGRFGALTVEIAGQTLPLAVHSAQPETFAGRDVLIAMVKDTPAEWIVDWANYHAEAHGTTGLILIDNGSDPDMRAAAIAGLQTQTALDQIAVVAAPFPYGDNAGGRFVVPAKFLQVSMLNLMLARFLGQASGVLSVDVDEFVQPFDADSPHRTIYDLARSKAVGCVSFTGQWAFAQSSDGPQRQRDHTLTDPDQLCRNPKWCIVPDGLAARFPLAVHRPAGPLFPFTQSKQTAYWHFRATSTGWKKGRLRTGPKGGHDDRLCTTLRQFLPSG